MWVALCPLLFGELTHGKQLQLRVEGQQHLIKALSGGLRDGCHISAICILVRITSVYMDTSDGLLILIFMVLKAGLIVAVFMHMAWERLALMYAILVPPVMKLVFVGIMVFGIELHAFHPDSVFWG